MSRTDDPLTASPPAEVHLPDAPLVRIIAQVRFPTVLAVERREVVAPFQETIRGNYPVLRQERAQSAFVGPEGVSATTPLPVWRFSDIAGDWRVSLSLGFLSLETTHYGSRSDFLDRFRTLLEALDANVDPKLVDRLGLRYINRVTGNELADIARLVHPELLGVLGAPQVAARTQHTLTESVFLLSDHDLKARWGYLPPNASVDPDAVEPIAEPSWILDLDLSTTGSKPFDVNAIGTEGERFAERAYAFFRWAVTEEFLERYGGKVS